MASSASETERRLRDLNGTLDMALLLACDAVRATVPVPSVELHRGYIAEAAKRLTSAGRLHGRFSLFSDEELVALHKQMEPVGGGDDSYERDALAGEIVFEMGRRGRLSELPGMVPA